MPKCSQKASKLIHRLLEEKYKSYHAFTPMEDGSFICFTGNRIPCFGDGCADDEVLWIKNGKRVKSDWENHMWLANIREHLTTNKSYRSVIYINVYKLPQCLKSKVNKDKGYFTIMPDFKKFS